MSSFNRKNWQKFKKDHPEFEKSKNFKSDVGPQLDEADNAYNEFVKKRDSLRSAVEDLVKTSNNAVSALSGYAGIANQLKDSDKTIVADFKKFTESVGRDHEEFQRLQGKVKAVV